ncbi:SDR family oxidoreductase [Endozoicomonas ascidiicola]|uniref:SDR family oxidoreductase n=1 Tax=Endozoicomonas ascidiicola TaxID=1698521 RepID=UPI0008328320|nr:SDR family oxidoreductase [Endozoicomonas ascidiicola]
MSGRKCIKAQNVLITGCSSGIGRTLALEFHHRGYRVWATARNVKSVEELSAKGMEILTLDVTDREQVQQAVKHIYTVDGHLDILVNNAGYGSMGPLIDLPEDELERQFSTNVFAPMALVRSVAPKMCQRRQGTIVNIGSVSGVLCTPFSGSYCASKAAINALSDVLRMELKPFGVGVVTVQPGGVRSKFGDTASQVLNTVMKPDSIYVPIERQVQARAMASQDNPTPAEQFCSDLVDKLESGRRLNIVRLAYGSFAFPLLKALVPTALLEKILRKNFGLDRLE